MAAAAQRAWRYGVAAASVLCAIGVRLALDPLLGNKFPFAVFYFAILVAARFGGTGPTLFAIAASALAGDFLVLPPRLSLEIKGEDDQFGMALFVVTSAGIGLLGARMQATLARAEESAQAARQAQSQVKLQVRDRTAELERSLDALRASEARAGEQERGFRLLVEGVREYAIYMLDPEGRVKTWNPGAERSKGYPAAEVLGRYFGLFFTAEDVAAGRPAQELLWAARDGRYETEAWRCRSDGSRFWASVLLTPLRDEHGVLIGYAKITRDLSERRRQQDLLARVAELAPFAMLLVDAQGRIVMVNAETERNFGWSRGELLGQPIEMLIPARLRARHGGLRSAFLQAPSARGMGIGRELYGLRKDGDEFPVEIGLSPIESGEGMNTLAAVFDITARRRQQLESARSLAEKEILLKEVYHRVKNNLQVVQSLLTLQGHALPEGPGRAALHDSVQRVRAMALVHEQLYRSGNLAAVPLAAYAHDLVRQLAEAHGTAGRRIRLQIDIPDVETGLDSAVPFGLLLTELVSNSFKHAFDAQGGAIRVGLQRRPHGDLLTVADDGIGFAPGFDIAAQTASMGLQLACGLAQQLGGELACRNEGGAVVSALLTRLQPVPVTAAVAG